MTIPCSVYIVTLNCAQWLHQTLASVADFAEVIILDSGSTDATYQIAAQYPNVRISHQAWQGYAGQKALALAQCQQEWVLNLDGDEELSVPLRAEIIQVIQDNQIDALEIPIRDLFLGQLSQLGVKQHAKVRCFRRALGQYDVSHQAHEGVMLKSTRIRRAKHSILHYGESSIAIKVEKNNQYSTLKALEKFQKHKQPNMLKLVLVMPLFFFKSYIIRRNFLNGWRGFVSSMVNAFYAFLKEAKLFEAYHQHSKSEDMKT